MSEWDDNLQGLASELKEARENRDNFIAETEATNEQFKKEIESQQRVRVLLGSHEASLWSEVKPNPNVRSLNSLQFN